MNTLLLLAALAQVQAGNWELTVTTWMAGADKPIGPLQQTQCVTEADARDPSRVLGGGASCEFSNRRESGDLYTFDVKCGGPLPMSGTGSIRQSADAFEGDLDLSAGQGFGMRSKIAGRRLGPC
ncbi:MAG TPA: DUF3617 family protein [Burkholderiales bacterium]|nr:DUF3617 family protein [Burkholderiales bacterium]